MKKAIRFLVCSDLHAHPHKRYSYTTSSGLNSRLETAIQCLRYIRELALQEQIKLVIFCGDLFDAKGHVPLVALQQVYQTVCSISASGIELIMIPGNHDLIRRGDQSDALFMFDEADSRIRVIHHPRKFRYTFRDLGVVDITAVPYRENLNKQKEWFDFPDFHTETIGTLLIAHGIPESARFRPDDEYLPLSVESEIIPMEWTKKFNLSLIGHIHSPQIVYQEPDSQLLIPGIPYQQFPFEAKEQHGVWLVEADQGLKNIQLTLKVVPDVPTFKKIFIDKNGTITTEAGESIEQYGGQIVLIQPHRQCPDSKIQKLVSQLDEVGVGYIQLVTAAEGSSSEQCAPRITMDLGDPPASILKKVVESGMVDLSGYDKDELLALGTEVLQEVLREEEGS